MSADRVPRASERIEEGARWVDVALRELDRESDVFHANQERCRQVLGSFLLRLQVLSIPSGTPDVAAHEIQLFEAAFRDTVRVAEEAYRAAAARRCSCQKPVESRPSPN